MNAIISLCHFCELHGPKVLFCTQPFHFEDKINNKEPELDIIEGASRRDPQTPQTPTGASGSSSLPNYKNDLCEGCTSVHLGYMSQDEEAKVSYISSQRPHHREVFAMIRQACIRSLSCEVCPGREGPIFFGDEQQGHTISYTFYVKDNQARGFQRLYSLLVVMMDKIYLLNSWPFLVTQIETVVKHLKGKADMVYEDESKKFPQKSIRLAVSVNPKNFIQQRGGANKPARSLIELTDDKNIFKILHMSFVWILKACGSRLSETLLEGPPTEDSIIDMEKQEETEEGFVNLFIKETSEKVEEGRDAICDLTGNLTLQSVVEDDGTPEFKNIRHLQKVIGQTKFKLLAHHTLVGNQIIVRGLGRSLVKSFIQALTCLLPKGCYSAKLYSEEYRESYICNFLGLDPRISIPSHVANNEHFLLIDVFDEEETKKKDEGYLACNEEPFVGYSFNFSSSVSLDKEVFDEEETKKKDEGHMVCDEEPFVGYSFNFSSSVSLDKAPSILSKIEYAVRNDNLCLEVVDQCLNCVKEEWMNKVKVLFKFTKAGGGRSEEDTQNLLKIVGAKDEDKPLLTYWMRGLSDQYKKHILSASIDHKIPP